ncbi:sensor histidine kinase [Propioniferax innocua]|uniref:histidine kinase n=1 Tax=Propioniferax innocua TaxID=1753 RepID=A0A542ZCU7_9ACTN|nr:histidine kinase [Propioniferax innocua]TQL58166.1 signal transduction histidine kinase [Propioniferax innocua]
MAVKLFHWLRWLVVVALAADHASFFLAQHLEVDPELGTTTDGHVFLHLASFAAIVAILWGWRNFALILWVIVMSGSLIHPDGSGNVVAFAMVTYSILAESSRSRRYLVLMAQLGFTAVFDSLYGPAWPVASTAVILVAFLAMAIRIVVNKTESLREKALRERRKAREIRESELNQLALELESFVVNRLGEIRDEALRGIAEEDVFGARLRIQRLNQHLRSELRDLVYFLRMRDHAARNDPESCFGRLVGFRLQGLWRWAAFGALAIPARLLGVAVLSRREPLAYLLCFVVAVCALGVAKGLGGMLAVGGFSALLAVLAWSIVPDGDRLTFWVTLSYATALSAMAAMVLRALRQDRSSARTALHDARQFVGTGAQGDRAAIARELHDVVGHQVSLIGLRMMSAHTSDEKGQRLLLEEISVLTMAAQAELEALLTVMRSGETLPAEVAGPLVRPRAVLQAMCDELAARSGTVTADISDSLDCLSVLAQRTVVRVVQESVTNILRHAPEGCSSSVRVTVEEESVTVHVANTLAGSPSAPPGGAIDRSTVCGVGLRGLHERVGALGGTFSAGAQEGRWVVHADIPAKACPAENRSSGEASRCSDSHRGEAASADGRV